MFRINLKLLRKLFLILFIFSFIFTDRVKCNTNLVSDNAVLNGYIKEANSEETIVGATIVIVG